MIRKLMLAPLAVCAAMAQTSTPNALTYSFNGAGVAIHTESSTGRSPLSMSGAVATGKDATAIRVVVDGSGNPLFAYGLELSKYPPLAVKVTIKPVDQQQLHSMEWLKGKVFGDVPTVSAVREFPALRLGDEVRLEIMYNPQTGEKLWDVLQATPQAQAEPKGKVHTGPQFSWEDVRIAIDGKQVYDETGSWMVGEAIKLRVPGHGESYLAVRPPAGYPFQPNGWVDRNVLRFRADGEQVEVTGKSNLLMKSETGTIWVYHVPEAKVKTPRYLKAGDGVRVRMTGVNITITCSGDVDQLMKDDN